MAMDLTVVCRDFLQLMSMTPLHEAGAKSSFQSTYSQKEYAENMRPISVSNKKKSKKPWLAATEKEISALRAVNGALGWLRIQTRPDLSVQTSLSQ